jgi:ABC-type oligopeptide transport system substrate-binding subunit
MIEENLGITVTVEQVEWSAFLQDLNQRRYQLFSAGWIGDYPDAQDFLDLLFHSGSAQNHTGYANTQVDQLLEQARVEQVAAKRSALYRQAERMIISDAPWIPLTHGITYTLVKPYVRGFAPSAALYPWLRDISIQK